MAYQFTVYTALSVVFLLPCTTGENIRELVKTSVAVLPCGVGPHADATDLSVMWTRTDLPSDKCVHFRRHGADQLTCQSPVYNGRTTLHAVEKGDLSLTLSRVNSSDEGNYTCYVHELDKEFAIQLIVNMQHTNGSVQDGPGDTRIKRFLQLESFIGGVVSSLSSSPPSSSLPSSSPPSSLS